MIVFLNRRLEIVLSQHQNSIFFGDIVGEDD